MSKLVKLKNLQFAIINWCVTKYNKDINIPITFAWMISKYVSADNTNPI